MPILDLAPSARRIGSTGGFGGRRGGSLIGMLLDDPRAKPALKRVEVDVSNGSAGGPVWLAVLEVETLAPSAMEVSSTWSTGPSAVQAAMVPMAVTGRRSSKVRT